MEVNQERVDAIRKALTNINKTHGQGSISFFGDVGDKLKVERISTGLVSLDFILGGGLPKGTIIELAGPPSAGKTTLSIAIMSQIVRRGGIVFFLDAENHFDPEWAFVHGIKPEDIDEKFIISQEIILEKALSIVEAVLKVGVDLVVVDSLAALAPLKAIEGEIGENETFGMLRSRTVGQFAMRVQKLVRESGVILLFTNQWRAGGPYTAADSPGGFQIKHAYGVRLRVKSLSDGKVMGPNGIQIAQISTVETIKNKFYPPYKECEFRIDFDGPAKGLNYNFDLLEQAVALNIVSKGGAWYDYKGYKVQGRDNMIKMMIEDEVLASNIRSEVRTALGMN